MRIEPSAAELLRVAREKLLAQLLPLVPGQARYLARMMANAMAIAAREVDGAGGDAEEELGRIMTLMPEWKPTAEGEAALLEGTRALAAAIRAGRFDAAGPRKGLALHLKHTTEERLAVSNPKAVK